jgi:hypothetical protein
MINWNENEDSEVNNNSFVFYQSFYSAMDGLSAVQKEELIWVICNYALYEKIGKMSPEIQRMFKLIKPQIDANKKKREDGRKGGRPIKKTIGSEFNKLRLGN